MSNLEEHQNASDGKELADENPSTISEVVTESLPEPSGMVEVNEAMDSAKHVQLVETLKWLSDNYERSDGVCLPRCVLYTHYLDFCKKHDFSPSSAATFGKVIRQKFPKLTTRRLGTRGQSKYHYYGISIKKTSIYYHSVYSGPGLTRFSEKKPKTDGSNKKFSLSSKTGTLLPEYPDAKNLVLPPDVPCEKVETFILMYRTHSQRLLDVIVSNNFDEVQNFLLHFWQGLPPHLSYLLTYDVIVDVIILCDSVLYKVLNEVLIPAAIQDIPESLSSEIRVFARKLPVWLEMSLDQIPEKIKQKKLKVVQTFVQGLRRQMSFIHLAQTARSVLMSHESITEMLKDLKDVASPTSFHQPGLTGDLKTLFIEALGEFECLMKKQAPLESFIEWIDCVIEKYLLKDFETDIDPAQFNSQASEFLMNWSFITSKLLGEFTMRSVKSFGKFHLLNLMLQEYALLAIETQHDHAVHHGHQRNVQQHMKKTAEMSTKAMVRSTNRKAGSSHAHKSKKRRTSLAGLDDLPNPTSDATQSHHDCVSSNLTDSPKKPTTTGQNSRYAVNNSSSHNFGSTYPSIADTFTASNSYVPLYQSVSAHSFYNDLTTDADPSYDVSYVRQTGDFNSSDCSVHGTSFPVTSFNYTQSTFPNPILPAHLPLSSSWNSPGPTGYGVYTDLSSSSSAPTNNISHLMSHDRSRDYRNYNYPNEQSVVDERNARYGATGVVSARADNLENFHRGLPISGDYLTMYQHGLL